MASASVARVINLGGRQEEGPTHAMAKATHFSLAGGRRGEGFLLWVENKMSHRGEAGAAPETTGMATL